MGLLKAFKGDWRKSGGYWMQYGGYWMLSRATGG